MSNPYTGRVLKLSREPDNLHDKYTVAVIKTSGANEGHVPYYLALIFSHLLARDFNKGNVKITQEKVNCGVGYELEVLCIYCLFGPKIPVDCLNKKVKGLQERGLLSSS